MLPPALSPVPPARSTPVSVCMAMYNGVPYLAEQVRSILDQLGDADELVIVDDGSQDASVEFLNGLSDPRVRLRCNESNLGVNRTFERAIRLCRHPIVFLADQDDVWMPGRLDAMVSVLRGDTELVSGNFELMDAGGASIPNPLHRLRAADDARRWSNIAGIFLATRNYYGCAMAFRAGLASLFLPIPRWVESHDLWIAMAGNLVGTSKHFEPATLRRRIHGKNASVLRRGLGWKLYSRGVFALSLLVLGWRALTRRQRHAAMQESAP